MELDIRTTAEISAQTITNNCKEWSRIEWVRLTDEVKDKFKQRG